MMNEKLYDAIMPTILVKMVTEYEFWLEMVIFLGVPHKLKGIMRYLYFHKGNIFIITEPINVANWYIIFQI